MDGAGYLTARFTSFHKILQRVTPEWFLKVAALLISLGLLLSHLNKGSDIGSAGAPFILSSCVILLVAALITHGKDIALGISVLAVFFLVWLATGLFGNWHLAKLEAQSLLAGGALAATGYAIGKTPGGLKFAWSALIWTSLVFVAVSSFVFFS